MAFKCLEQTQLTADLSQHIKVTPSARAIKNNAICASAYESSGHQTSAYLRFS